MINPIWLPATLCVDAAARRPAKWVVGVALSAGRRRWRRGDDFDYVMRTLSPPELLQATCWPRSALVWPEDVGQSDGRSPDELCEI